MSPARLDKGPRLTSDPGGWAGLRLDEPERPSRPVREVMMAQLGGSGPDAVPIGEVVAPPFARTPSPDLFRRRAARFAAVAPHHPLGPYLSFLGRMAEVQAEIQDGLPDPALPPPDALGRSREYGMPALPRSRFSADPACRETLRRFFRAAAETEMPPDARAALGRLVQTDDEMLAWMADNVTADAIPAHDAAAHVFAAAALQVYAARAASRLDAAALVPVGDGICPACGSPPTSSVIVGWEGAHGARFCSCSLCGTLWNYVRIRCTACGSTEGISYQELDGSAGAVKAECCSRCRTFAKVLQQAKHPALDPVADDVATLALDMLLGEEGLRRSGRNPFLMGY